MEEGDNMDQEKEIITFEELFKGEKKQTSKRPPENNKRGYTYSLLFYALVMYVVASILVILMMNMPSFTKTWTEDELVMDAVASDAGGFALVTTDVWNTYLSDYGDYVKTVGFYYGYVLVINSSNTEYYHLLMDPDFTESEVIDPSKVELIIAFNSTVTAWTEDVEIAIYQGKNAPKPTTFTVDANIIEGPVTSITGEASSILNFVIYLIMVPGIIYFMKSDLILDFKDTKDKKREIIVPIIIGYAYVWVGNIVSTFLSTYLAGALDLEVGEAANQQAIISAVTSSAGILMIISAVFIGPVIEELIFRKAIFGLIKSNTVALIVSTFVFGLIHVISETSVQAAIVNGVSYFVMGFVFSYIYLKAERNVMIPIIVHIINNAVSILLILLIL